MGVVLPSDTPKPASHVWGLSATPFEVGPIDIFSLLWAIAGRESPLGTNPTRFERLCHVSRFKVKQKNPRTGKEFKLEVKKIGRLKEPSKEPVRKALAHHHIRHPREIVAQYLPALQVIPVALQMGAKQAARYDEIVEGRVVLDYLRQELVHRNRMEVTAALRLHYLLRCADGLTSLPHQKQRDSVKLDWVMNILTGELGGEKTLVYSRYHQPLDDIERKLEHEGIPFGRIDGKPWRTPESITETRHAFNNDPDLPVLLITGKASYAMEFQVADYGIAYNRPFNPKKIEQLHGRIRRIGGGSHKTWYHLLACPAELDQWDLLNEREEQGEELGLGSDDDDIFAQLPADLQERIVGVFASRGK